MRKAVDRSAVELLVVRNLRTHFPTKLGIVRAVDGIDLEVRPGEVVGLVGESGSGKSVAAYSILGLPPSPGRIISGEIRFEGEDLAQKTSKEMQQLRGSGISMIFQEPLSALNPVFQVGVQIRDVLRQHLRIGTGEADKQVVGLLSHVGIPAPREAARRYPFELSGGMRQRVLIAMAIACHPALVIADEPTTALDTTIQAQIIELLRRLVREDGVSILLITHDLGLVAELCERVYVMYAGQIVERGRVEDVILRPRHPYTSALIGCVPTVGPRLALEAIEGVVPTVIGDESYCRFAERCRYARTRCFQEAPRLERIGGERQAAACHFAGTLSLPGLSAGLQQESSRK